MSLLSRFGRWITRAAGATAHDEGAHWGLVSGMQPADYQRTGREVRLQGWERNAVVNACARAIVDIVASVDLEVCRAQADGTLKVIANHDAAVLLNTEPRVGVSGYAYRAQAALHFLLYGQSLQELERRGRRKVAGVRLIHPEQLQYVYLNPDAQIVKYDWRDALGELHQSPAEDVLHIKDLSAGPDALFGFPRAAAALGDIAADSEATDYVRQVVNNHGVPGMVVVTKGVSDETELRVGEERFNERMTGRGGRGKTVFIQGEQMQFEQIGFNLAELEFPDLRKIAREDICTAFAVDPRMVGIGSASNDGGLSGVQYREARFRLIQQAVIPVMKAFEAELNRWYMPEFGEFTIRFRPDTLSELTEDEHATSARVIAEVGARIRTLEEGRETLGLSADVDPKHHFLGAVPLEVVSIALEQAALSPTEKAKEMAEAVPPVPVGGSLPPGGRSSQNGNGEEEEPADEDDEPAENRSSRSSPVRALLEPAGGTPRLALPAPVEHRAALLTESDRLHYWRAFETRADDEEPSFLRRIHDLFGSEWVRLASLLASAGAGASYAALLDQVTLLYSPTGPFAAAWATEMRDPIRQTLAAGARHTAQQAPMGASSIPTSQILAASRRQAHELAVTVTRTTLDQIRGLIAVAEAQRWPPSHLATLIQGTVFGVGVDQRASLITRTEIPAALNRGSYLAAVDSHAFQSKLWVSQRDDRVRESHRHAEGEGWVWIEKAFGNGLQYPGDPSGGIGEIANCRCTVAYSHEPLSKLPEPPRQRVTLTRYSPDQPRDPAGTPTGGQWTPAGGGASYTSERQQLHDAIVRQHFQGITPVSDPTVYVMGGGPAAGKTAMIDMLQTPSNAVRVDPDRIKTLLPEYREGVAHGDANAGAIVHEESSAIAKRVVAEAAGYNVVMDGTGDNSYESLANKVAKYRAGGAKVVANYVTVDTETAVARAHARGLRTGRFVPETYIRETHRNISAIIPRAVREGLFDELTVWDNNGAAGSATRIASYTRGRSDPWTIFDQDAWDRFLAKAR